MTSWANAVTTPESKLVSFVKYAIAKLEASEEGLTDGEGDDYQELCNFCYGLSRNLKATGHAASKDLKGAIREGLLQVWDIRTETPGDSLKETGVEAVQQALKGLLEPGGALGGSVADYDRDEAAQMQAEVEADSDEKTNPPDLPSMSLPEAIVYLWDVLDKGHRLEWGDDGFTLDMQSKANFHSNTDRCDTPLVSYVNKEHPFWGAAATKAYIDLLDNYERETGVAEQISASEKRELDVFLDAFCATDCARFVFKYLQKHGVDPRTKKLRSMQEFRNLVYDLWFAPYRRKSNNDSSGFEHVFVGEEKYGKITGMHNWLQYYLEEQKGNIDYLGWAGRQDSDYSDDCNIVSVKFVWDDNDSNEEVKPISTMLFGSTVDFELAVLTLAFLGGNPDGDNPCKLGTEECNIVCHSKRAMGGFKIGTAYLEIAK